MTLKTRIIDAVHKDQMANKTVRIITLINALWPSTKFDAKALEVPFDAIRVIISKASSSLSLHTPYMASLDIEPNHAGRGYIIRANYPGFNGTVEQMADSAEVISLLVPFMTKLNESAVIKGE